MIKEIILSSALLFNPVVLEDDNTQIEETTKTTFTSSDIVGYTFTLNFEDTSYDKLKVENETDFTLETYVFALNEESTYSTTKGEYTFDENLQVISLYNEDKTSYIAQYVLNSDFTMEEYTSGIVSTIVEKITNFASEYLNYNTVLTIVSLALNSGLLSAIAGIYFKYRKYKATSSEEIQKKVLEVIKDNFGTLGEEQLTNLVNQITNMEKSIEIMQKALILAQDKTAEGKKALIELLSETSTSEEVKSVATNTENKIVEEQKEVEKVQEEVKNDYTPID